MKVLNKTIRYESPSQIVSEPVKYPFEPNKHNVFPLITLRKQQLHISMRVYRYAWVCVSLQELVLQCFYYYSNKKHQYIIRGHFVTAFLH